MIIPRTLSSLLFSLALLFSIVSSARGQAQDSLNMTLFDRLNPVDSVGTHSSLWGYTDPAGREYALFGSQIGTHIIDITERPIRQVAYVRGAKSAWREMKTYGRYAYVVSEASDSGAGLQIIDLSELPQRATLLRTDTSEFIRAHTIFIRDHYMYIMGTQPEAGANQGAIIFDLEPDPLHPRRIGKVDPYYYHDAFVRNDTLIGAAVYGPGADIYDIRDKAAPVHLATIKYPNSGTHNAELTADGNYVVTSDEVGYTQKTMKVWDIRDLQNIRKAAEFTPNPNDIVHNVHIIGRYAYVAWYTAGVRIIDMIDPEHPREVGFYDTYKGRSGGFNGVWEVYGHFASGKIIVSDRQTGLYVLEFNGATAGSVSGVVRDASTNALMPGATITVPEQNATYTTDAAGRFYIGAPNGTQLTLVPSSYGYRGEPVAVTISGDATRNLTLQPLPRYTVTIRAVDLEGAPIEGFSYAIEPHIHSTQSGNGSATVMLPAETPLTLTVGKWGYTVEEVPVTATSNTQEVVVRLEKRYQDNATLDLGWRFGDPGDGAISGKWLRLIPYPGLAGTGIYYVHPPSEPQNGTGHVFITGVPSLTSPPEIGDVNGGTTTLTSPLMDLTDHPDPVISFDLWFAHYPLSDSVPDSLFVEISNNDGASWTTAYSERKGRGKWYTHRFYPLDLLTLSDRMRVRVRVSDTLSNAIILAAMDNFDVGRTRGDMNVEEEAGENGSNGLRIAAAPNPAGRETVLTFDERFDGVTLDVELFDSRGERVRSLLRGESIGRTMRIETESLPAGWYVIRARDAKGRTGTAPLWIVR